MESGEFMNINEFINKFVYVVNFEAVGTISLDSIPVKVISDYWTTENQGICDAPIINVSYDKEQHVVYFHINKTEKRQVS
jgi:hypothetical protein